MIQGSSVTIDRISYEVMSRGGALSENMSPYFSKGGVAEASVTHPDISGAGVSSPGVSTEGVPRAGEVILFWGGVLPAGEW
jgi:hypothetical protein